MICFIKFFFKKLRKYFETSNIKILTLLPRFEGFYFLDIGAAGVLNPRWKNVENLMHYIGVEPDMRSANLLRLSGRFKSYELITNLISDRSENLIFNLCAKPEVSSFLTPNFNWLDRFPEPSRFNIEQTVQLDACSLDQIKLEHVDFLKIDVQGAEFGVLQGGVETLDKVLGLEIEVEFHKIYENQHLFGEIQDLLSKKNFEFFDFVNLYRWERTRFSGLGQCVFADALFLKTPEKMLENTEFTVRQYSAYIGILVLYKRFDLIDVFFDLMNTNLRKEYADAIATIEKCRTIHERSQKINKNFSKIISCFGSNYRTHLMY